MKNFIKNFSIVLTGILIISMSSHLNSAEPAQQKTIAQIEKEIYALSIAEENRMAQLRKQHQQALELAEQQHMEQAIAESQRSEEERILRERIRQEQEAKTLVQDTVQTILEKAIHNITTQEIQAAKETQRRDLLQQLAIVDAELQKIPDLFAKITFDYQADQLIDRQANLEKQKEEIKKTLEKTYYPENLIQPNVAQQDTERPGIVNDCGFRSVRHAILASLWATQKLSDIDFKNALVDTNKIVNLTELEKEASANEFSTLERDVQALIQKIAPRYNVNPANITTIDLLLGMSSAPDKSFYIALISPETQRIINEFRHNTIDTHLFIINSDQTIQDLARAARGAMTHWLTVLAEKRDNQYKYTILDSLNKARVQLQKDLAYLLEKYNPEEEEKVVLAQIEQLKESGTGRKLATESAKREFKAAQQEATALRMIADQARITLESQVAAASDAQLKNVERAERLADEAAAQAEKLRIEYEKRREELERMERAEREA